MPAREREQGRYPAQQRHEHIRLRIPLVALGAEELVRALAQGFIPAIAARELLLRKTPLRPGGWLFTLVAAVCLAISAIYELIEWAAAVALGQGADEFLGTQGDQWDTQSDMFMALVGGAAALLTLSRWHDRQLKSL